MKSVLIAFYSRSGKTAGTYCTVCSGSVLDLHVVVAYPNDINQIDVVKRMANKLTDQGLNVKTREIGADKYPGAFGFMRALCGVFMQSNVNVPSMEEDISACDVFVMGTLD